MNRTEGNNSKLNWINSYWLTFDPMPKWTSGIIAFIISLILIIAPVGNAAVISVYLRQKRLRKQHLFGINLALCGILGPLSSEWMLVDSAAVGKWNYGALGCNAYGFLQGMTASVAISTVTVISVERYISIFRPFVIRQIEMRMKLFVCLLTWIYALALTVPPLIGWSGYQLEGYQISCNFEYIDRSLEVRTYIIYLFTFAFALPLGTITFCYVRVFYLVRKGCCKSRRQSDDRKICGPVNNGYRHVIALDTRMESTVQSTNPQNGRSSTDFTTIRTRELKLVRTAFLVSFAFVVSWTPYAVIALLGQFGPEYCISPVASILCAVFAKMSVVHNPFIYGFNDNNFRGSLKKMFKIDSPSLWSQSTVKNWNVSKRSRDDRTIG